MSKKITDLQQRSSVVDTVNIPVDDGIQSYRVTAPQVFNYIRNSYAKVRTITAAGQTLLATDVMILVNPTTASFVQALPTVASIGVGTIWTFKNIATNGNAVTLTAAGAELIDGVSTLVLQSGDAVDLYDSGTGWVILQANLQVVRARLAAAERTPVGVVLPFVGPVAPTGYLFADGSVISRTTYAALFAASTIQLTANVTSASTSVTGFSSTTGMEVGHPISGAGIPAGAYIAAVVNATSITLSAAATATNAGTLLVVAPHGTGEGSTTFNLPNLSGVYIRGHGTQTINAKSFPSLALGLKQSDSTAKNGLYDSGHVHTISDDTGSAGVTYQHINTNGGNGTQNVVITTYSAAANIVSTDSETKPASISMNYIVKY